MTTVKLPKDENSFSILKVVFLLLAVLGTALLLWKHDPYTAAVLEKDAMALKKVADASLRKRSDVEGQQTIVAAATAVAAAAAAADTAAAAAAAGGGDGSRTYAIDLASLQEGKTGQIILKTHPEWAPLGAARFHELMDAGFYEELRMFRVVRNFVVQFGIQAVPGKFPIAKVNIKDDPVKTTNSYGTVTFAMSGPNSRTTQIFININKKGNAFLDKQNFSPFAEIVSGMEFVEQIYSEYGEKPNQGKIQSKGNEYLKQDFPLLSYISSTKSVDSAGGRR